MLGTMKKVVFSPLRRVELSVSFKRRPQQTLAWDSLAKDAPSSTQEVPIGEALKHNRVCVKLLGTDKRNKFVLCLRRIWSQPT